jgi:hypothetical protein
MQSFPRPLAKTIDGAVLYHDIDIVNAHSVLLSQICELFFSFVTNYPQNYLKNHPKNNPKNNPKNYPKTPPKNPPKPTSTSKNLKTCLETTKFFQRVTIFFLSTSTK